MIVLMHFPAAQLSASIDSLLGGTFDRIYHGAVTVFGRRGDKAMALIDRTNG
jgi:hypothetical protein